MSRPADPTRRTARRTPLGVIAAVVLAGLLGGGAFGQPPVAAPAPGDVDDRSPLAPVEPPPPLVPEPYRIDPDKFIFREIEDFAPVRSEKERPGEYQAWTEVVTHARKFPAADLENVAARELTTDDLRAPTRDRYKLRPVRFDGKLNRVRRVDATKALQDAGVKDTFEGFLHPTDEPAGNEVCVVFSELPAGVDAAEGLVGKWVSFAGYSFKLNRYPGPGAKNDPALTGWKAAPLLIGRTVTLLPGPPAPAAAADCRIPDKSLRIFRMIRDDARAATEESEWGEAAAFNWAALFASKFSEADLEAKAKKGLKFADLYEDVRRDYKLDLVHVNGWLIRLDEGKPTKRMKESGLEKYYEGWVVQPDEPRGNPICVVATELPEGLTPAKAMRRWVSTAGYSFKLLRYTSQEPAPGNPDKFLTKHVPLLIGRSFTPGDPPDGTGYGGGGGSWGTVFVPAVVGLVIVLAGSGLALTWWFRRGDSKVKAAVDARRTNPFGG